MSHEYEQVDPRSILHFKVFIVELAYRTPHIHRELEICLLLDGAVTVVSESREALFRKGDFFVLNPFQPHELRADGHALILSVQIPRSFSAAYFPAGEGIEFRFGNFMEHLPPAGRERCTGALLSLAEHYFRREEYFELICVSEVNRLLYELLRCYPTDRADGKDGRKRVDANRRMQRVVEYIGEHYTERLFLSEIAEREGVTMAYLSHLFKDSLQMSFHDYVMTLRCEKARYLLLRTELNLLDIAMTCGFSDVKYLNRGFLRLYGCTPRNFKKSFDQSALPERRRSILSAQTFLSEDTSLGMLERFRDACMMRRD